MCITRQRQVHTVIKKKKKKTTIPVLSNTASSPVTNLATL